MNLSPRVTTFHSAVIPRQHTLPRRPPAVPQHSHDGLGVLQHAGLWSKRGHRARPMQRASPPAGRGDTTGEQTCMQTVRPSERLFIVMPSHPSPAQYPLTAPGGPAPAHRAVLQHRTRSCKASAIRECSLEKGPQTRAGAQPHPRKREDHLWGQAWKSETEQSL